MNLRRIPTWLRIAAPSVLVLIILLIAGGVWLSGYVKRIFDPEVQWAAIQEVIAVDEPPPSYRIFRFPQVFNVDSWAMNSWVMVDEQGHSLAVFSHLHGEEASEKRKRVLDRESPGGMPEPGTIVVQGRELPCVRFRYEGQRPRPSFTEEPDPAERRSRSSPAIAVDLSSEDPEEFLACVLMLDDNGVRVEDAQVVEFLKPFHVGPDR